LDSVKENTLHYFSSRWACLPGKNKYKHKNAHVKGMDAPRQGFLEKIFPQSALLSNNPLIISAFPQKKLFLALKKTPTKKIPESSPPNLRPPNAAGLHTELAQPQHPPD
jgi:hypothetical protein